MQFERKTRFRLTYVTSFAIRRASSESAYCPGRSLRAGFLFGNLIMRPGEVCASAGDPTSFAKTKPSALLRMTEAKGFNDSRGSHCYFLAAVENPQRVQGTSPRAIVFSLLMAMEIPAAFRAIVGTSEASLTSESLSTRFEMPCRHNDGDGARGRHETDGIGATQPVDVKLRSFDSLARFRAWIECFLFFCLLFTGSGCDDRACAQL